MVCISSRLKFPHQVTKYHFRLMEKCLYSSPNELVAEGRERIYGVQNGVAKKHTRVYFEF